MSKARQNIKKRAEWFADLAVATKDPERAADYTWIASSLDKRRHRHRRDPVDRRGRQRRATHPAPDGQR